MKQLLQYYAIEIQFLFSSTIDYLMEELKERREFYQIRKQCSCCIQTLTHDMQYRQRNNDFPPTYSIPTSTIFSSTHSPREQAFSATRSRLHALTFKIDNHTTKKFLLPFINTTHNCQCESASLYNMRHGPPYCSSSLEILCANWTWYVENLFQLYRSACKREGVPLKVGPFSSISYINKVWKNSPNKEILVGTINK